MVIALNTRKEEELWVGRPLAWVGHIFKWVARPVARVGRPWVGHDLTGLLGTLEPPLCLIF